MGCEGDAGIELQRKARRERGLGDGSWPRGMGAVVTVDCEVQKPVRWPPGSSGAGFRLGCLRGLRDRAWLN